MVFTTSCLLHSANDYYTSHNNKAGLGAKIGVLWTTLLKSVSVAVVDITSYPGRVSYR